MRAFVRMMTEYNRWANDRLFADCRTVDPVEMSRDFKAEFSSIHGTLDHILLVDRLWLARFANQPDPFTSYEDMVTEDFDELAEQRAYTDEDLTLFSDSVTEAQLAKVIQFSTIRDPQRLAQPLGSAMVHLFHHQSQYRAQVQVFLHMLGARSQILDLLHFQCQTRLGVISLP
ncbi:DinB family protein [Labrenzia sp. CE80]|uniref:DinB family protein n=1 Tax=Labrenzia sp. CE80 TaxID=1788986 RepID=UPI0013894A46|nr:DinB family protein [Labrenzia sp. CE80]